MRYVCVYMFDLNIQVRGWNNILSARDLLQRIHTHARAMISLNKINITSFYTLIGISWFIYMIYIYIHFYSSSACHSQFLSITLSVVRITLKIVLSSISFRSCRATSPPHSEFCPNRRFNRLLKNEYGLLQYGSSSYCTRSLLISRRSPGFIRVSITILIANNYGITGRGGKGDWRSIFGLCDDNFESFRILK